MIRKQVIVVMLINLNLLNFLIHEAKEEEEEEVSSMRVFVCIFKKTKINNDKNLILFSSLHCF